MKSVEHERQELRDILLSGTFDFERMALHIFDFQYRHNTVYQTFCRHLHRTPGNTRRPEDIPFLPIRFFKTHIMQTGQFEPQQIFQSSGTTGMDRSRHRVRDTDLYEEIAVSIFEKNYGPLEDYIVLALLPSYLEQGDSSLVYMIRTFVERTGNPESGFYRFEYDLIRKDILKALHGKKKVLLWGVTYALMDLAEDYHWIEDTVDAVRDHRLILMETGGMKGRRIELVRSEVHSVLQKAFGVSDVHSEYGMTELLSQCYSKGQGVFDMSATMKVFAFDVQDPLTCVGDETTGRCHVIDLANLDSCSFIATDDLCRTRGSTFEILGRMDHSDIRGCNLLYTGSQ